MYWNIILKCLSNSDPQIPSAPTLCLKSLKFILRSEKYSLDLIYFFLFLLLSWLFIFSNMRLVVFCFFNYDLLSSVFFPQIYFTTFMTFFYYFSLKNCKMKIYVNNFRFSNLSQSTWGYLSLDFDFWTMRSCFLEQCC